MDPELIKKKREYEARKNRTKLALNICTICGKKDARPCKGCGTTAYCSTDCQRIDWRDRGHKKACKKIREDRAAEAARAEAPTPPPSPPRDVFYGPAPRSHADEVRARIAAEHEAARLRREANPEPEPSSRVGSRCPVCFEDWDVNTGHFFRVCCCRLVCNACENKISIDEPCPLCRTPTPRSDAACLAILRRHVENEVPEAITELGDCYITGGLGVVKSVKKAVKIYKRAVELGNVKAMAALATVYSQGWGGKPDKLKATRLYRMAADRGNALAQHNLACNLELDPAGYEEAFRYFRLAADHGYRESVRAVGYAYDKGRGVEVDREEARRWYERAAAKGIQQAIDDLARLDREARKAYTEEAAAELLRDAEK